MDLESIIYLVIRCFVPTLLGTARKLADAVHANGEDERNHESDESNESEEMI